MAAPSLAGDNLIYVSNVGNNTVTVYTGTGKLVQTLTDFKNPHGLCVDKTGDVFVVNSGTSQIFEYSHGGTTLINTLSDPYPGFASQCSVDLTTGNLAVTDLDYGVLVYPGASGTPSQYADPKFFEYFYPAYDDKGNLFVDGYPPPLAELPKGGSSLISITLNEINSNPNGLQWDGKYLAICFIGHTPSVIGQYSISGSTATLQGTTRLGGARRVDGFSIPDFGTGKWQGGRLLGAESSQDAVPYWRYPAGRKPFMTITDGLSVPVGVAVSPAVK